MEQQVALITGTSSGFGERIARTIAANGIRVYAGMRNTGTSNERIAQALNDLPNIHVIELDVTREESIIQAVDRIKAEAGRIDTLVNNAGVYGLGLVEQFTNEEIQQQLAVNFFGPLNTIRQVLPLMRANRSGLIINISSGLGRITMPFNGIYGATKHAMEAVSQALRHELTLVGVDVVVIEPGIFPSTNASASSAHYNAKDKTIAAAYGELAVAFPDQMNNQFKQMVDAGYAADPQLVADKVYEVIATSSDARPFRVVVDPMTDGKMEQLNKLNDQMQQNLLNGMQLDFLYR